MELFRSSSPRSRPSGAASERCRPRSYRCHGLGLGEADAAVLRRYVDADVVVIVLGHLATDGRSLTWRVTEEIVDRPFAAP